MAGTDGGSGNEIIFELHQHEIDFGGDLLKHSKLPAMVKKLDPATEQKTARDRFLGVEEVVGLANLNVKHGGGVFVVGDLYAVIAEQQTG